MLWLLGMEKLIIENEELISIKWVFVSQWLYILLIVAIEMNSLTKLMILMLSWELPKSMLSVRVFVCMYICLSVCLLYIRLFICFSVYVCVFVYL